MKFVLFFRFQEEMLRAEAAIPVIGHKTIVIDLVAVAVVVTEIINRTEIKVVVVVVVASRGTRAIVRINQIIVEINSNSSNDITAPTVATVIIKVIEEITEVEATGARAYII